MEFWGVEVKSGQPLKVSPGDERLLHLSQGNVGEVKKQNGNESVKLFVTVDGKKLVIGTLLTDKLPQQQFDLLFEKDFELSHNWKNGSVFFHGYLARNPVGEEDYSSSGESDEDIPLNAANNGKQESKAKEQKSAEVAAKPKVTSEPGSSSDEDTDDDSEDQSSDSSDDTSDESEEETPKKAETSKKRSAEAANKTPVSVKKAKSTPQSADGKKGSVHVDTPHPAKKAGKTPANQPNQQTPKSGGSHPCNHCGKTFGNEKGLESHSKAKHGK